MPPSSGSALAERTEAGVVLTPAGELIRLSEAADGRLAETVDQIAEARDQLSDLEAAVTNELRDRLDRAATWTLRVREGENEWEIKAASPQAGTEVYRADALEAALRELVAVGVIDEVAAEHALERTLSVRVALPWQAEAEKLAEHVAAAARLEIAGVPVRVLAATTDSKPVVAGIKAVRKVPGADDALDSARADGAAPVRKVRVTRK